MTGGFLKTAKRLQTACRKLFGVKLLIQQRQWYSDKKDMAMTMYVIQELRTNDAGKKISIELFKTYSQVQLVLFMRDYWYKLNGWEIPTNNPIWEEMKEKYAREKEATEPLSGEYDTEK